MEISKASIAFVPRAGLRTNLALKDFTIWSWENHGECPPPRADGWCCDSDWQSHPDSHIPSLYAAAHHLHHPDKRLGASGHLLAPCHASWQLNHGRVDLQLCWSPSLSSWECYLQHNWSCLQIKILLSCRFWITWSILSFVAAYTKASIAHTGLADKHSKLILTVLTLSKHMNDAKILVLQHNLQAYKVTKQV